MPASRILQAACVRQNAGIAFDQIARVGPMLLLEIDEDGGHPVAVDMQRPFHLNLPFQEFVFIGKA